VLLRSGGDFLYVNRLLGRIKLAGQHDVRGREVLNGFGIFDNPDGLIIVSYEDGSLGFPFRVTHGSTPTPAFLHAIRASGLRVVDSATLITDPTGPGCFPFLSRHGSDRHKNADEKEKKKSPAPDHPYPPSNSAAFVSRFNFTFTLKTIISHARQGETD
jgi:hypothetical protein